MDRDKGRRALRAAAAAGFAAAAVIGLAAVPAEASAGVGRYAASADTGRSGALKQQFLREAAAEGRYYDANFVDHLVFTDTDGEAAEVVTPRDFRITSVEVSGGADALSAEVIGQEAVGAGAALAFPSGPGFGTFSSWSSGSYTLTTSRGNLRAYWYKLKDTSDGSGTYDWWAYKRRSVATPANVLGVDDVVDTMGMRSYPTSATRSILRGWVDWAPPIGPFDGDCNSSPMQLSAYGVGISFKDCETYRVDWNPNSSDAGDMSVNWENSGFYPPVWIYPSQGPQEMAYVVVVKTAQGQVPVYHDYQYVNFAYFSLGMPRSAGCGSTGQSVSC